MISGVRGDVRKEGCTEECGPGQVLSLIVPLEAYNDSARALT